MIREKGCGVARGEERLSREGDVKPKQDSQ